ncbi:MAG: hypothetical protein ACFFC7_19015 [Candidatus Hermodarchaeota archaeon]
MKTNKLVLSILVVILLSIANFQILGAASASNGTTESTRTTYEYELDVVSDSTILSESNFPEKQKAPRSGAQSFAVILAYFSDNSTTRWTKAEHEGIMDTLNDFWKNMSHDEISISYKVSGWHNLGNTFNSYSGGNIENSWQTVIRDAVDVADSDFNFANYDYVLVWINHWVHGSKWRGWSSIGDWFNINTDEGSFSVGASLVGERGGTAPTSEAAVWGRTAHEMGHAFGLYHTHVGYNSDYSLMARAYPADLTVYSLLKDGATGWFPSGTNMWTVNKGESKTLTVNARYRDIGGDIECVKIPISSTEYYYVEIIRQKSEDAWVGEAGVYIYLVEEDDGDEDCTDQLDTGVGDLWDVGDTFTGTGGITVKVDSQPHADAFQLTITNPGTSPADLQIDDWGSPPGSPPPYETPDIWVDSIVNGWDFYRHRYGSVPTGIGDEPWANHENRLYARIQNIGGTDAVGVNVNFYENLPIGVGDSGSWNLIDTKVVDVTKGSTKEIYVLWTPTVTLPAGADGIMDLHSCVRVTIDPVAGETATGNNHAQENIGSFEVITGTTKASFEPFIAKFVAEHNFKYTTPIYVNLVNLGEGWTYEGAGIGELHSLGSGERKEFEVKIIPGPDLRIGDQLEAYLMCGYVDWPDYQSADGPYDGHLKPLGGISVSATIMYRSKLEISATFDDPEVSIRGNLSFLDEGRMPEEKGDRTVLLEIWDLEQKEEAYTYVNIVVENDGSFVYNFTANPNPYQVRAYYMGSDVIASSSSATIQIDGATGDITTITPTSSWVPTIPTPSWTLFFTLGALIVVLIIRKRKRKED